MTREEYHIGKRNLIIFGWVLVAEAILAFGFWVVIIYHLNPKK
jgi:hypothetical protein